MIYTIFIIPLLILIIGILLLKKPPKQINWFIGYRTKKSMETEKNWIQANKFCGKLWIKFGVIMFVINIILLISIYFKIINLTETFILIVTFFQITLIIISSFIVENNINNKEKKN